MTKQLKRGVKVHVEFDVIVPIDCTEIELRDWLGMEFHYTGYMPKNVFTNYNNDPCVVDFFVDYDTYEIEDDNIKELEEHER